MTNQHPVTPPPDKIHNWLQLEKVDCTLGQIITIAAQWGADQELEACCEYVYERLKLTTVACIAQELRADRRPKPPSLKKQALEELAEWGNVMDIAPDSHIRRALEALDD
jgi:hypothetical protein